MLFPVTGYSTARLSLETQLSRSPLRNCLRLLPQLHTPRKLRSSHCPIVFTSLPQLRCEPSEGRASPVAGHWHAAGTWYVRVSK